MALVKKDSFTEVSGSFHTAIGLLLAWLVSFENFWKSLIKVGILSFTFFLISKSTSGQIITNLNPWSNVYHGTSDAQTPTYTIPLGSSAYRMLVVAIASSQQTTPSGRTVTLTYGGQALTPVNGDLTSTTNRAHTQLYYLKEAGLDAATSQILSFSITGGTTRVNDVFVAVFDGVDQTTPITDSKNYSNVNSSNPVFGTALNVGTNDLAIEIISSLRSANPAPRTITSYATNWSSATTEQTFTTVDGVRNAIASRTVPSSGTTDVSSTTFSGTSFASMTALSLNAITTTTKSWYSYSTGNFNDYTIWTLDPSGTSFLNGLHLTPGTGDDITILNGNTITSNVSNLTLNSTTIQNGGVLDMAATTGHNLGTTTGAGLLRIKGTALPTGTYTDFVSTTGGTIEYYDASGTLPTTQTTYNNLMLSGYSASATFIEASDLTVNGIFTIGTVSGANTATWQINDNSGNKRTITLNGDLYVNTNGAITVKGGDAVTGTSATPHVITMYGDFTNYGTVRFFDNTASANLLSDANWSSLTSTTTTNVATSVYIQATTGFGSTITFTGTDDQTVTCNGITYFYNLVVNKGTTTLPILNINSSSATNFRLYGPANYGSTDGGQTTNDGTGGPASTSQNALSIANGTLELTGTITIPILEVGTTVLPTTHQNSLYALPQTARLWLNSSTVSVNTANAYTGNGDQRFILQGILEITDGTFSAGGFTKGLVTGAAGALIVEGGTLNAWQIRPAAGLLSLQNFSYVQSGGTVNVGTNIGTFTDPNTGSVFATPATSGVTGNPNYKYSRFAVLTGAFQMTGGTLNIGQPTQPVYNATYTATSSIGPLAGGIDIESASGNYNVTGGTVNVFIPAGTVTSTTATTWTPPNNFSIYSTAPLYNLNVYKEGVTTTGTAPAVKLNYDLTVLNNLTLVTGNSPTFDCNGTTYSYALNTGATVTSAVNNDLTIGGNFIINSGTTFTSSTGTGVITFNGTAAQSWTNSGTISAVIPAVVVNKTGVLTVQNTLGQNITSLTLTSGTLADNGNTIAVTSKLSNSATHSGSGGITYSAYLGTIDGNNGTFGNLTLSANSSVTVMSGNQTVTGNLSLTGNGSSGAPAILNIGSNSLTVGGNITSTIGFGHNSYILTSGLHQAGGLTRPATAAADILFPVGVLLDNSTAVGTTSNRLYTPNTVNVTSATTFGTITVRPVNNVHPNVTTPSASLAYYWRVTSSGFTGLGTVTHKTYQFGDGTVTATKNGTATTYIAARFDRSNNTWGYYSGAGQTMTRYILTTPTTSPYPFNTATTWSNVAGSQLDGEYTCGNSTAFGTVTTYYSLTTGQWNVNNTWYTITSGLTTSPATSNPTSCSSCPVVIGDGSNSHYVTIPTTLTALQLQTMCGTLTINTGATLDCGTNSNAEGALVFGTNTTVSSVGGGGTLRVGLATLAGTAGHFPSGDFTNFIGSGGGTVEYYGTTTTGLTIPSTYKSPTNATQSLATYYNLIVSPFAGQIITLPPSGLTIYNDLTQGSASSYTGTVVTNGSSQTISVGGNLTVSYGTFNFINTPSTSTTTLNVTGNIINNGTLSCAATTANNQTNTHLITVFGGITNNNVMNLRQYTSGTRYNFADITFNGTNNVSLGGTATGGTTLDLVTVNKGTSQAPTVTCSLSGVLNTTAAAEGWLTLTNGAFDFEYTGTTTPITLSTTSYTIPSTAKLKVGSGTVQITNTTGGTNDLFLNGALEVAGGTIYTYTTDATGSDNDIEYAAAGTPSIIVSGGSLSVDGSIRRSTSTLTGALVYNQTGGTVTGGGNNSDDTRGVFEMDHNTGSSFTMTGGTLNVQRQNQTSGNIGYADVYINPATSNVSSASTISVGLGTVLQSNLRVDIVPAVGNFTVAGGTNAQTVKLYNDLTVGGTLTITSPSTLDATQSTPNANVSVAGNFNCTGTYTGGTNTTTFNGSGAQSAVLTSSTKFYNLTVNKSAGTLTVSGTAPAAPGLNNLSISSGILEVGKTGTPLNNTLKVNRNIIINGSQIGTQAIEVYSTTGISNTITSSNGSFTNLTLGGTVATATISVSGNLTISGTLNLLNTANGATKRYLNIGSSQLTFGSSAPSPSGLGTTAFIKTNGVASDLGVVKSWATGIGTFVYAVGTSSNYTPVSHSLNVTTAGTLTVVPVNSAHPTYNQALPLEQILNYYWTVKRSSSLSATTSASFTFTYPASLFTGSGGTLVAAYLDPTAATLGWAWSPTNGGTATTTLMTFATSPTTNFPSAGSYYDYSVGTQHTLPNPIAPVYSKLIAPVTSTGGGNWTTSANWTYDSDGDPDNNGNNYTSTYYSGPHGLPVVILPTAQINLDMTGQIAYKTTINGILYNPAGITGHNLGIINGTGTFRTATGTFPAGVYDAFVLPSPIGGTIEYAATTTMNNRSTYNNLIISNSATTPTPAIVTMTTTPITINGNLTVTAGNTLIGNSAGGITLAGNFVNAGTSTAGAGVTISIGGSMTNTGTMNVSSSTVNLTGNLQNTTGTFNGGTGTVNLSSNFSNGGTFNGGSGIVNLAGNLSSTGTFTAGTGTVKFNGTAAQSIANATTFYNLTINNTYGTAPQVTVSGNQTVGSTLTLLSGLLNLNGTTMTIGTSCASIGAVSHSLLSSAGWVYGGSLTRYFATGTIPDGSLIGFFPVGTAANFRPFSISATSSITTCGTFSLGIVGSSTSTTVVSIPDLTNTLSPTIMLKYQGGWTVSSSGVAGGTYNIFAGGTGFGTIGSLLDVTLCKAISTVGTYVGATLNSTSDPRMERTGLALTDITTTDGNQFFVGSNKASSSPLPIELLSFTGDAKKYGVDLQWKTASEMNNDFFTVSRSATGANFEAIGTVSGNGTTNAPHSYSLLDSKPQLGKNYYQLKQTDFDGHITTSETIVVNVLSLDPLVSIYPNPLSSNQILNVAVNGLAANSPTEIQIVNVQGTTVNAATLSTDPSGSLNTSIALTGLSAGLYILKVQNIHYKFVIE